MKGQTRNKKESLSKEDLISSVANLSGLSKADSTRVLDAIIQSIQKELAQGNDIRLMGFGTFCVKKREARDGHNPRTGKKIKIAATTLPKFKAGKSLKEKLELFQGKVSNVHTLITFQGRSLETLRFSFQDAVNEYIAWCKKHGSEPEKPSPDLS